MFSAHDGNGWRLAGSLYQLTIELNKRWPDWDCLGTVGDLSHQDQWEWSDHNPVVRDPRTGVGIIRAIDISKVGINASWLFNHFQQMYANRDARLWKFGYAKMDGQITDWDNPGRVHPSDGDYGHIHLSLTQSQYPSVPGGYVPAIDSRASWGIAEVGSAPAPTPANNIKGVPRWPLPGNEYFGNIKGPNASHGGFYANERPYIKMIQQKLQALRYAPNILGWADGIYEQPTVDAVAKWQHAKWAKYTTRYGEIWADDWQRLFS